MPDLDILAKGIPRCFHVGYRLLCGGASEGEVVRAVGRGLTQALRQGGGIPGLDERTELVDSVAAHRISREEAIRTSRELVLAEGGSLHAQVAHSTMSRMVADPDVAAVVGADQTRAALAAAFCHNLVDNQLLGRARPDLIGTLYVSAEDCDAAQVRLHSALNPVVDAVAEQLTADPTGRTVQAPPTPRAARSSTAQILDEVVG